MYENASCVQSSVTLLTCIIDVYDWLYRIETSVCNFVYYYELLSTLTLSET